MPASLYCSVCSDMMEYRNIIKFENIETEESYFAKSIGAGDIIHPRFVNTYNIPSPNSNTPYTTIELHIKSFRWENKNSNQNISKEDVLAKYFSQVSTSHTAGLLKQNY